MKPTDVNHARFILDSVWPVIYDDGGFSVVLSPWLDVQEDACHKSFGMRWDESPGLMHSQHPAQLSE